VSGTFLLDTNAAIARIGNDPLLVKLLADTDEVFVPSIVLGELYYGAERSGRVQENLAQVEAFAAGRVVLVCDTATARLYGRIAQQLRRKGRPIPQNDIWIAATALQYDLTLVTRDEHFKQVEGLALETW
jgi:tRNA(fMet)-specific endonuclease VapC